jgi:hypothetical protein
MKNQILIALCFFCLGTLTMTHELCKQKDSMIRLLMKNNSITDQQHADYVPKNLPVVTIK